jgi:putative hydrolase of the HAD superfamily
VVDSNRVGFSKPDLRIFAQAVRLLGTDPGETLHVGDSYERDIVAARAAGLRAAWLVDGTRPVSEPLPGTADFQITSLDELAGRIQAS